MSDVGVTEVADRGTTVLMSSHLLSDRSGATGKFLVAPLPRAVSEPG